MKLSEALVLLEGRGLEYTTNPNDIVFWVPDGSKRLRKQMKDVITDDSSRKVFMDVLSKSSESKDIATGLVDEIKRGKLKLDVDTSVKGPFSAGGKFIWWKMAGASSSAIFYKTKKGDEIQIFIPGKRT